MGQIEAMQPGDELSGSESSDDDDLKPDEIWTKNRHRYELYNALMQSGDDILDPDCGVLHPITGSDVKDRSYLRRLPGESPTREQESDAAGYRDPWQRRRDASCHYPIAGRIIWTYVDTYSRQDVDRSQVEHVLGADVVGDVDLEGTDAAAWTTEEYALGLQQGFIAGLVDTPHTDDDMPSRYHEMEYGIRPYVRVYDPKRCWKLRLNNYREVQYALLQESVDTLKEWGSGGWRLLDRATGRVLDRGQHSFGRVPIELFIANKPDRNNPLAPYGVSAMRSTALIDIEMLHHMSMLGDVVTKTGFPFYHCELDQDDERLFRELLLGAGMILALNARGSWQAPPAECRQSVQDHIEWLESIAMRVGGVHRRSQDSVEAHSGLSIDWENAPIYATIHRWARQLQQWETRIWRLMAMAMGKSAADIRSIGVDYPDDFSTRPADQDLSHAEKIQRIYDGTPPPAAAAIRDELVIRAGKRLIGSNEKVRAALVSEDAEEEPTLAVDPQTALNGIQVKSEMEIVMAVARREIPRESGVSMLALSFPFDFSEAEKIMGEVGKTFFMDKEEIVGGIPTGTESAAQDGVQSGFDSLPPNQESDDE